MFRYSDVNLFWSNCVSSDGFTLSLDPFIDVVACSFFIGCISVQDILEFFIPVVPVVEDHLGDDGGQDDDCSWDDEDEHRSWSC